MERRLDLLRRTPRAAKRRARVDRRRRERRLTRSATALFLDRRRHVAFRYRRYIDARRGSVADSSDAAGTIRIHRICPATTVTEAPGAGPVGRRSVAMGELPKYLYRSDVEWLAR